jgi:hypothetical protein
MISYNIPWVPVSPALVPFNFMAKSNSTLSENECDEKQMRMSEINKINKNFRTRTIHEVT